MAMIECPHPQLCNGVKRHHDDSASRSACATRGRNARSGASAPAVQLSGVAAFAESQQPENLAKKALSETFGTDDVEILEVEAEVIRETKGNGFSITRTGKHTALLADTYGEPGIKFEFDSTLKTPVKLTDRDGNEVSVSVAAQILDNGTEGDLAGFVDSAPGSGYDTYSRLVAADGSVFFQRGRDAWATKDSVQTSSIYDLSKKHGMLAPDTGEGYEAAKDSMERAVLEGAGITAMRHFESARMSHSDRMRSFELLTEVKEMDERNFHEFAQGAIFADASAGRFGYSPRDEFQSTLAFTEAERRDKAEHAEECPAIGNRYQRAWNDAAEGSGARQPALRTCTCK